MEKSFLIKDYMNPNPVTVTPETRICDVIELILKYKVSGVVVADQSKNYSGVLSELDCLKVTSESIYNEGQNAPSLRAQDIMKTDVVTASPNAGLFDILICMLDEGQRRRPVIEDGKLIGQVTCRHLLKAIINFC
ncbi:MAG: CBS domain-containing protein [Deltaproteobacteria bacterium]|jgi:CBS domain-containing protein|nr:CBS domain-containing protein [Deltaproteobacteria bacterium]